MVFTTYRKCIFWGLIVFLSYIKFSMARNILDEEASIAKKHEHWISKFGRRYTNNAEKVLRRQIFKDNMEFIEKFNSGGNHSYKLKANQFTDLNNKEFLASQTGMSSPKSIHATMSSNFRYQNVSVTDVPKSLDWRLKGAVTGVQDQGNCGCCWAFSAVAAVEGIVKIKTGKLISLSVQQVSDCDTKSEGCNGGFMDNAFDYIIKNHGITTEANYPYLGGNGNCDSSKTVNQVAQISGYEEVPGNGEAALLTAVASQPVSIGIDASGQAFQFYSEGVFTGNCGKSLNHAMTAIGYGISDDGAKFWLMKNSWGVSWGQGGYMTIQRDSGKPQGLCGLAMLASYPTAEFKHH